MKKIVYEMVVDIWRLAARYQFRKLSESEWESFIADGKRIQIKYRQHGSRIEHLCRDWFDAVQTFYQQCESCTGATEEV